MRYRVCWSYVSSLGGPWHEGQLVELTEEVATAVNATSPGVLEPAPDDKQPARKTSPAKKGAKKPARGKRQVKKPSTRAVTEAEADR